MTGRLPDPKFLHKLHNELWDHQGANKKCFKGVKMGKGDRCAVFGCNNDRKYPEKLFVPMLANFDFTLRLTQKIKVSGKNLSTGRILKLLIARRFVQTILFRVIGAKNVQIPQGI